jgi:hypothetical protein
MRWRWPPKRARSRRAPGPRGACARRRRPRRAGRRDLLQHAGADAAEHVVGAARSRTTLSMPALCSSCAEQQARRAGADDRDLGATRSTSFFEPSTTPRARAACPARCRGCARGRWWRAAGLLDQEGHRVGLVHQAQLAGLVGLALVPGVEEDAAAREDAVHVGHHAGHPAHVEVLAARAGLAGQAFVDVARTGGAQWRMLLMLIANSLRVLGMRMSARSAPRSRSRGRA